MEKLSIEEKAKAYDEAIKKAKKDLQVCEQDCLVAKQIFRYFPELAKPEDEKVREEIIAVFKGETSYTSEEDAKRYIAWLEKQGSEPNWCHHKVDLSNCSEEYRKAYYDGWNNCNQQHSQCKSEWNDVVKCLINGMKFYYEDNEEATWGTEKFSMKVKDILSWLEKQGEQKSAEWSEDDEKMYRGVMAVCDVWSTANSFYPKENEDVERLKNWLKSLKTRITWKPSDEQMDALDGICSYIRNKADWEISQDMVSDLYKLSEQLKKLRGEKQ